MWTKGNSKDQKGLQIGLGHRGFNFHLITRILTPCALCLPFTDICLRFVSTAKLDIGTKIFRGHKELYFHMITLTSCTQHTAF